MKILYLVLYLYIFIKTTTLGISVFFHLRGVHTLAVCEKHCLGSIGFKRAPSPNSCTRTTSECDLSWKKDICRYNKLKQGHSG